jgi:hypothetical protein
MAYTEFFSGSNWQQSSGPIVARKFHLSDLWPVGAGSEVGGGNKDELADGLHPILAIGSSTPAWEIGCRHNLTGVVIGYNAATTIALLNMADKVIVRNYVANISTYDGSGSPTYSAAFNIGQAVYVDDSSDLSAGVTLSLSPFNEEGSANPLAGYLMYCQDEYMDGGVGGPNTIMVWPKAASNSELVEAELCVMLVNDSGQSCLGAYAWWPKWWQL